MLLFINTIHTFAGSETNLSELLLMLTTHFSELFSIEKFFEHSQHCQHSMSMSEKIDCLWDPIFIFGFYFSLFDNNVPLDQFSILFLYHHSPISSIDTFISLTNKQIIAIFLFSFIRFVAFKSKGNVHCVWCRM